MSKSQHGNRCYLTRILALALFCLCAAGNALAVPLIWGVSGTFNDGGTLAGSFDYDPDTTTLSSWNIYTSAGSFLSSSSSYNPTNSTGSGTSSSLTLTSSSGRRLTLRFATTLTTAGGTVNLTTSTSENFSSVSRTLSSGTVSAGSFQSTVFPGFSGASNKIIIGTPPLPLAAKATAGSIIVTQLPSTFDSTTPAVCKTAQAQILPLSSGTCTIQSASVSKNFTVSQPLPAGTLSPSSGSPFTVGGSPEGVASGDFNEDGNPDLAVANAGGTGTISILLGDGTGNFPSQSSGSPISTGSVPNFMAVGDFNEDGHLDLAVTNSAAGTLTILLGDGTGNFSQAAGSPFSVGASPYWVAVGDFNGDGRQDLAVGNFLASGTVSVFIGNGAGGFAAATGSPFSVGTDASFIAVADMNNDGVSDLVVANNGGGTAASVSILLGTGALNTGGALFTTASGSPFSVPGQIFDVIVADFNGDGLPDFATPNNSASNVTVMLAQAGGGYAAATGSPFAVGPAPQFAVTGDFNGDGKIDLAVTGSTVTILLGNGTGNFTQPAGPFSAGPAGSFSAGVPVTGDFNGDGIDDIVVTNAFPGGSSVGVLLGTLAPTTTTLNTTSPLNVPTGQSIPLSAVLSNPGNSFSPVSGTSNSVKFLDGATPLTTVVQTGTPVVYTIPSLSIGSHSISAQYQSGSGSAASTSNTLVFNITGTTTQTITFNLPPNVAITASPVTMSASSTSTLAVSFSSNSTAVCTTGGTNGATVTLLMTGTCSITASQNGNATFAPATPVTQAFTVLQTQTITFNSLPNVTFGAAPFTISATATSGLMVSFASNTTPVCTVSSTTVTIVAAGVCSITASQAGNSTFAAATPVTQTFTVQLKQRRGQITSQ